MKHKSINDKSVVCEIQPIYKNKTKAKDRLEVKSSQKTYEILLPYFEEMMDYKELFFVMYLNRNNQLLAIQKISEGGCSATICDGKIIFQGALLANAQAIILAHNHPSGNLKPSDTDKSLTEKMCLFGGYIDLPVIDHMILTSEGYFSFAEKGLIH